MAEVDPDHMGDVKLIHLSKCFACQVPALHLVWKSEERENDVRYWMSCTGGHEHCDGGLYEIAIDKNHRLAEIFAKFPTLDTNN